MPSAFNTSSTYSISRRLPSASGKGIAAKKPKRVGLSLTICAAYSLHFRARVRAACASPNQMPGCGDREDGGRNAAPVHLLQCLLRRPLQYNRLLALPIVIESGGHKSGREEMMMQVD